MKIDVFNHIFPRRFFDTLNEVAPGYKDMGKRSRNIPALFDLDVRFKMMDQFGDYRQIISIASPPIEVMAGPDLTPMLSQIANDGMAELVARYPDRFPAFAASLPMNNPEQAALELQRAVKDLGAKTTQIYSNADGKPLDGPEYAALFEIMAEHDLPILLHPARGARFADYAGEKKSKYEIWWTFGWPYETSVAMARLVFSGLFDRFPNIKIVTHHMGAMIPYFEGRVGHGWDQLGKRSSDEDYEGLLKSMKKRPIDYFKMFYADTALFGSYSATKCGLDFFGVDRVLFASDSPFDPEGGTLYTRETIGVIDRLDITEDERDRIYYRNAERLFKLSKISANPDV
ncbi:MAG TPA: amidohydrolase family protein [Blastocatellia bacterium]|nr:amidohydrolase family protein [Blastocatellia bacterium]